MTAEIKLSEDNSCLKISGALNVDNVVRLRESGSQLIKTIREPLTDIQIDLQDVTACDSPTLALLTALARDAKKAGKYTRFINVPSQLMAIARLSDLDSVLKLEALKK
jgi:phospholipid transport system transporter-binding protein